MSKIMMIMVSDGLRFPSGTVSKASYSLLIYCRVPDEWVEGSIDESPNMWLKGPSLKPEKLELLFDVLYGAAWRSGNSDGSQYVVLGHGSRLLNPTHESQRPWQLDDPSNPEFRFHYYETDANGHFKSIAQSAL